MQPEKLLRSFPWQCEIAENARAELENTLRPRDYKQPRVSISGYSDTTAYAAIDLAKLAQLEARLKRVRRWIDAINDHQKRRLLISVWRGSRVNLPWDYVAKDASLHPVKALLMWRDMINQLETHIGGTNGERYPSAS